MAQARYYVVWIGLNPGVYDSWEACKQQVEGWKGAVYKGFATRDEAEEAINMPPEAATEAEIDQQLEQLLSYHVTFEDETEDRAVVEGDVVVLDVENKEGVPELEGTDRQFGLKNAYLPTEFVEGIVGMSKGDSKEISWSKTHGDHEHNYAVAVTLKGIKKSVTPELDDEFAKKSFGFDTVQELRDAVKEEIENDKKTSLPNLKEDRVVEEAGKRLVLDEVPEAYQNQVFSELANEFLGQLGRQGMNLDMYLAARQIKSEDFLNDLREQATERARQSLALDAIARKMGFDATEDDVKAEFERAGVEDVEKSIAEFTESGQMPAVRESIRRTKALNWLTENVKVNIVDEIAEKRAAEAAEAPAEEPAAEEPKDIEAEVDAIMAEVHEAADAPAEETSEE